MTQQTRRGGDEDWVDLGTQGASAEAAVPFTAILNLVGGFPLFESSVEEAKKTTQRNHEDEYLLTLRSKVKVSQFQWLERVKEEHVEFLVILDRSGSMAGKPWMQVQSAMLRILSITKDNPKIQVRIMTYNDQAEFHKISSKDMAAANAALKGIRATGMTNFAATFEKVSNYLLKGEGRDQGAVEKSGIVQGFKDMITGSSASKDEDVAENDKSKVYVFFMTDGQDTCNSPDDIMAAKERLQKDVATYGQEVIVNVLGFGDNHDDNFLESLSMLGTSDGTYNYIKPDMGDTALEERLITLLESTTGLIGKSVFLELRGLGPEGQAARFFGDWFGDAREEVVIPAFLHLSPDGTEAELKTTKFLRLPAGQTLQMGIKMMRDLRENTKVYAGRLAKTDVVNSEADKAMLLQRKLRSCLNIMTAKLGESVDSGKTEAVKAELGGWLATVKAHHAVIPAKAKGQDEEYDTMAQAVSFGLKILESSITRRSNEDDDAYGKRVRDTHTSYNLTSKQAYNQVHSKGGSSRSGLAAPRTKLQLKKTEMS